MIRYRFGIIGRILFDNFVYMQNYNRNMLIICFVLLEYLILSIGLTQIFRKAGVPWWYGIIPIFNIIKLYSILLNEKSGFVCGIVFCILHIFFISLCFTEPPVFHTVYGTILMYVLFIVYAALWFARVVWLSDAFHGSLLTFLGLLLCEPLFACILGFGKKIFDRNGVSYRKYKTHNMKTDI